MKIIEKLNLNHFRVIYPVIAFMVLTGYIYREIQISQEKRGIKALRQTRGLIMDQPLDLGRQDFSLPSNRSGDGGTQKV